MKNKETVHFWRKYLLYESNCTSYVMIAIILPKTQRRLLVQAWYFGSHHQQLGRTDSWTKRWFCLHSFEQTILLLNMVSSSLYCGCSFCIIRLMDRLFLKVQCSKLLSLVQLLWASFRSLTLGDLDGIWTINFYCARNNIIGIQTVSQWPPAIRLDGLQCRKFTHASHISFVRILLYVWIGLLLWPQGYYVNKLTRGAIFINRSHHNHHQLAQIGITNSINSIQRV